MIPSVALTVLIYKYNISSGVYTPACDIPLLRSLFLSDTNIKKYHPFLIKEADDIFVF